MSVFENDHEDDQAESTEDDEPKTLAELLDERAEDVKAGQFVTFEEHADRRSD